MINHPCIGSDSLSPECLKCPIRQRDFCHAFQDVMDKISAQLGRNYSAIPLEDQKDILTIITEAVLKNVHQYEGRRGAKFATWVWSIYQNKLKDYFRKKTPDFELLAGEAVYYNKSSDLKNAIAECFKAHLPDNSCVRLYFDLYHFFQKGRTQKELAYVYHVQPNTLNQRIKRCRPAIRKLFRAYLDF